MNNNLLYKYVSICKFGTRRTQDIPPQAYEESTVHLQNEAGSKEMKFRLVIAGKR